jgi:hypothetical protein
MDFLPDGTFYLEDPAALKIPETSEGSGATATLQGPGSGRRLPTLDTSSGFIDDGTLRVADPDALAVPDPNTWRAADPITPVKPISGSGSNWEWDWETGLVRETWMSTIQQDQHAWEKVGRSWDWLAGCCGSARLPRTVVRKSFIRSQTTPASTEEKAGSWLRRTIWATTTSPLRFSRASLLQAQSSEAWGLWHCIYHFKTTRALRRTTGDPNANSLELGEKWEAVEGGLFGLAEGMGRPVFMMLQNAWARKAYWAYEAAQDLLVYNPAGVECADLGAKTWKEIWCCCNQRIREQKSTLEQIESVFGHVLVDSTRLEELRKLFLDTSKGLVKHYGSAYGWLMASGWFRPIYLILREQLEDKVKDGLKRIPSLK